jgi:hypothetical protein
MTYEFQDLPDINISQWGSGSQSSAIPMDTSKLKHSAICPLCDKPYSQHGTIEIPDYTTNTPPSFLKGPPKNTLCPGDYLITATKDGRLSQVTVIPEQTFRKLQDTLSLGSKETVVTPRISIFEQRDVTARLMRLFITTLTMMNTETDINSDQFKLAVDELLTLATKETKWVNEELLDIQSKNITAEVSETILLKAKLFDLLSENIRLKALVDMHLSADQDITLGAKRDIEIDAERDIVIKSKRDLDIDVENEIRIRSDQIEIDGTLNVQDINAGGQSFSSMVTQAAEARAAIEEFTASAGLTQDAIQTMAGEIEILKTAVEALQAAPAPTEAPAP